MLKDRIAELKAVRDQARADAERAQEAIDRAGPSITPQALKTFARQARKRMRDRERRLPPRSPARARSARRSGRERSSHHGVEKRTAAHARRRVKRENGGFWRAQFCTEVARPKRFELLTPKFVVRPGQFQNSGNFSCLAIKPLTGQAEFAAFRRTRPHTAAITARRSREAVRHIRDHSRRIRRQLLIGFACYRHLLSVVWQHVRFPTIPVRERIQLERPQLRMTRSSHSHSGESRRRPWRTGASSLHPPTCCARSARNLHLNYES